MKQVTWLFFAFITSAFAHTECKLINEFQIRMDAHASNFRNAETTRTTEGGAYRYRIVICKNTCKIQEVRSFTQKYLPTHPDADINGYVTFPQIDKAIEKGFISTYAKALLIVTKSCPATGKVLETQNGSAALITYKSGRVVSDTINFLANGSVVSWIRQTKNGEAEILNF